MSVKVCLFIVVLKACLSQQFSPPKDYLQHKIPSYLEDCYSNPELRDRALRLPSTINTLVSLIQKAERDEHTEKYTKKVGGVLDATVMSYSILHRFRLDGIVREPDVPSSKANITGSGKGVIPYAPMGPEFNKYKILFGELIPGNAILFPNSTLGPHEKCALHFMLSSTVDLWERGDEGMTCKRPKVEDGNVPSRLSRCPLEDGVMAVHTPYSLRADTVSPGTVIAGIAASLQHQEIPLSKLLHNTEDGVAVTDWIPVLHDVPQKLTILNTWAATLAGDMAEVAIYQGPYKLRTPIKDQEAIKADLKVGAEGWWGAGPNIPAPTVYTTDSRVAKWYYLLRNRDLEMTDAEIRGGIDGK
ncbi:hypothetical protein J437_LFUL008978 [Ladona fulva]|uniref:Uncharacterized protein n=1 Tax=Ladona fulva TaxID=123851 RepID=A0A8K0K6B0_LADFU|nr:hypothetical protein J437_LFUL008978 [Ladona fulva]